MQQPYVELSHTIESGMITYKGLPAPLICDFLSREDSAGVYEEGTTFQIGKIEMVGNTGTYIDCPFHRYADGKDFSHILLDKVADLPGILVHVPFTESMEITPRHFAGLEVKNKAVLLHTGWSAFWRTDRYFENHPFLNREAALLLREKGAKLVGIDSYNLDDTRTRARPAHSILLGAEILIVEHLTGLEQLPADRPFHFSAIPPRIVRLGSFPVRAYARVL